MNKKDLKKLCLLGLTCGVTLAAQSSANAAEGVTLAGGCGGMSSPRSFPQTSEYAPSSTSGEYYAPAPVSSCAAQSAPRYNAPSHGCAAYAPQGPQGSCSGQRPAGGYVQGGYTQGYQQGDRSNGTYYYQQEGNRMNDGRNFNSQNQQWGQNDPNAGNSKNFPSSMSPAQGNNPINNQNLQNPITK